MNRLSPLVLLLALTASTAEAQEPATGPVPREASPSEQGAGGDILGVLAGGALGLGLHESGHLLFDVIFGASPGLRPVSFGPIPFFAITHRDVSPAREFVIASAGFWLQHASNEWLLTRNPNLRQTQAPVRKGLLAFNVLASTAYGIAAFAEAGPAERDTRTMARELRIDEGWVGAMLLAPAALDVWRYHRPESDVARWSSRAVKIGMVVLILRAAR